MAFLIVQSIGKFKFLNYKIKFYIHNIYIGKILNKIFKYVKTRLAEEKLAV